nr:reverse transcriptase domain-containing protein [Tanacetum cinerariifolium]
MEGLIERGGPEGADDREETPPPLTKEQIEWHMSALKSLIKSHNRKNKGDPIRLDFETVEAKIQGHAVIKGKEMPNNIKLYDGTTNPEDHLSRFAGAANSGEWTMPVWCRMFQQTLDGSARGWACFKEPHEITKIIKKDNESLTTFKERWTVEAGFIIGVLEVMKISSFMDSVKSPELAKRFSNKVPTIVNEMMERLDDFVWSEEAYVSTELSKGETRKSHCKMSLPFNRRDTRLFRNAHRGESRRDEFRNGYRGRDAYRLNRARDDRAPYPPPRREYNFRVAPVLTLNCLTKHPKEILATEMQLCLPEAVRNGPRIREAKSPSEGHTSKGKGTPQQAKIINVIGVNSIKDKKRKVRETTESWMNIPISFPVISSKDVYEEPLILEAKVEGYLVKRDSKGPSRGHWGGNKAVRKDRARSMFRRFEKKQMIKGERLEEKGEVAATEEVLINPSFPDQLVAISGGLSEAGKDQIKCLLKDNVRVFPWEPSDMTGVPRDEKMLLADIAETFDNLKKINMKLNPKKCSFGVEEGKFLGYMEGKAMPRSVCEQDTERGRKKLCSYGEVGTLFDPRDSKIEEILLSPFGAYNITFIPRNDVKGKFWQISFQRHQKEQRKTYTSECRSGIEYTYALRLTFSSTNNEDEYEALLAGLRIAWQMNISNIDVKEHESEGRRVKQIRICGVQPSDERVVRKAIRQGYYWPTMHEDAKKEPFYQWGMDILGPLPPARGGAKFVIMAIEYFTKWIEAKPLVKITGKEVNGLVKRENRSLMKGIKTRLGREKARWVDELPNVLWAHRTSIKQSNEETPFRLKYGSKAVIPIEIGIPTYRTLMIRESYNKEEMRLNLDLLQEKREAAAIREAKYMKKMEQYYNRRVFPVGFRPGEFVFRRNKASRVEDQGK